MLSKSEKKTIEDKLTEAGIYDYGYDHLLDDYDRRLEEALSHNPRANKVSCASLVTKNVVYYLMQDDYVCYIGQTTNLLARLGTHKGDGKDFNGIHTIAVGRSEMLIREAFSIYQYNPSLNIIKPSELDLMKMVTKEIIRG